MKLILTIVFVVYSLQIISAQQNTDSIFAEAISASKNQDFSKATKIGLNALKTDSTRGDIMIFIANLYSWQNKNDSALIFVNNARRINYVQSDLYEALTNINLRTQQYQELLESCNEAEKRNYSPEDILKKRLIAYTELKRYDEGIQLIEASKYTFNLKAEPINSLYSNLLIKRNNKVVSANFTIDLFDNIPSRHLGTLGYSFRLGEHTMSTHINYANRFEKNDVQLGTDFYLQMINEQYLYLNYDFSLNATLFPRHRFGIEFYFPLKRKREASLGMRYLGYINSPVFIFTGHLGKYFGKNWMGLRPYYVTQKATKSLTVITNYKRFGKSEFDFWGVELGFGNSPDDIYANSNSGSFNQLNAYRIKLERNLMLTRISDLRVGMGYTSEEYGIAKLFRSRYTIEFGYKIRLK